MSRSYRKISSCSYVDIWPDRKKIRSKERWCIFTEIRAYAKGDAVFPSSHDFRDGFLGGSIRGNFNFREKTREKYTTEVRNILNGYSDHSRKATDFEADFIEAFYRIKGRLAAVGHDSCFEWLNTKEAKETIKVWEGEPIEVLYYLNHHGIIEKAVHLECKRMVRK
jgi:hypothetical protein